MLLAYVFYFYHGVLIYFEIPNSHSITCFLIFPQSRSKHYEVYTEASYCLSQLITFCNSVFLDNLYVDNLSGVLDSAGGGSQETSRTDTMSLTASSVSNSRGIDYYMWVMTRLVTHVEVLLEKAAGALWGENSKERSLLVRTYPHSLIILMIAIPLASSSFMTLKCAHAM